MIGQIQFVNVKNIRAARRKILKNKKQLLAVANAQDSLIVKLGGGARDIEVRFVGKMLVIHLIVNVKDAMGANLVNTMAEAVTPYIKKLVGGAARLRIISNLATMRMVRAKAVWKKSVLGGAAINSIIDAYEFARLDPYRCATHNKGVMNGVDAVAIATGNDFRALEAGAHAFAALDGGYAPLTRYYKNKRGDLVGEIELPIAAGTVGGITHSHPVAQVALKILDVKSAQELAQVMACVGLANNFAALRAMVVEGIQKGHMKLHARHIAMAAGAHGRLIKTLSRIMVKERRITSSHAKELLERFRRKKEVQNNSNK
jgi:hydroxymethylglutaryl-CoA reductase